MDQRLSFCQVTQDGDDEGCLRLFDLPTPEQAVLIRKAIGLKRKRAPNVGSFRSTAGEGFSAPISSEDDGSGRVVAADTNAFLRPEMRS